MAARSVLWCNNYRKPRYVDVVKAYALSKSRILSDYTRYNDAAIAWAKRPYATAGAEPPLPKNEFVSQLTPVFGKARIRDVECQAKNDLLMLEFALHAYHLEHGGYPDTLDKLVPGYLQAVPLDPYGAGSPLHYQRAEQGYLLYSNGPNSKDDHGTVDDIVVKKP